MLYDNYLGTGSGLSELGIVYDEEQADDNLLLVITQPDENGIYTQRSLMLSRLQLARLWQEKAIKWIELRDGDASALIRIDELLTGDMAKLIALLEAGKTEITPDELEAMPETELSVEELSRVNMEVQIVPIEDGGYCFGVYVWYDGVRQAVTELAPSFEVCLNAGEQGDEAEHAEYTNTHVLSATDAFDGTKYLNDTLQERLGHDTEDWTGRCEYFNVSVEIETGIVVLYDPDKVPNDFHRWSLCADWAGDAIYRLVSLEAEQ